MRHKPLETSVVSQVNHVLREKTKLQAINISTFVITSTIMYELKNHTNPAIVTCRKKYV